MANPIVPHRPGEWVSEESVFEGLGYATSYKVNKLLHEEKTEYQDIKIYETRHFGNLLVLDGVFQNTEADEFSYHEMMTHVPLFAHPNPRRVLIIGGGDGGIAREVLKHSSVEHVDLVDIDKRVTDLSRIYFKKLAVSLDNPKLSIYHEDGAKFVACPTRTGQYDVVIVDSSDPIGPGEVLFRAAFYKDVYRVLNTNGVAVAQGECMWLHSQLINKVLQMARGIFETVDYYYTLIPVYPCGIIGMLSLSKGSVDMTKVCESRSEEAAEMTSANLMYYNPDLHRAAFVKPSFFKKGYSFQGDSPNQQTRICEN